MKAVKFNGSNMILAKDQPEFNQLPIRFEAGVAYYCHELTFEEIQHIIKTKRIWGAQQIGSGSFHPMNISVEPLFDLDEPKK